MTHDRDYWRAAADITLIETALASDCELCIALGERLDDCEPADVAALRRELDDALDELKDVEGELADMRAAYDALEETFDQLRDVAALRGVEL